MRWIRTIRRRNDHVMYSTLSNVRLRLGAYYTPQDGGLLDYVIFLRRWPMIGIDNTYTH